jgi:hypothetical protein
MLDVTVSSDAQSCVVSFLSEEGSSGNALIGVPCKVSSSKHTISLIDNGSSLIGVPSKNRDIKDIICLNDIKGISLMPVFLNLRDPKDFIGTVISGKLSSFEQPLISNDWSLVRNWIDEGTSLSGVPSNFRIFKDVICLNDIEGISLMPVSLKPRYSKDSIGTVISGKLSSFEQPLISNDWSLVRNWIDEGSSLSGVPPKPSFFKDVIGLNDIEGSSLMPVSLKPRYSKDSIGTVISGRLSSFEQPLICKLQSLVRNWIDEGTSLIAVPLRSNSTISFKFSGNLVIFEQPLR